VSEEGTGAPGHDEGSLIKSVAGSTSEEGTDAQGHDERLLIKSVAGSTSEEETGAQGHGREPPPAKLGHALGAAAVTTVVVTAASYLAPDRYAGTLVGLVFLAATWWLVLRCDEQTIRAYGLSLGGLLEPVPLSYKRLLNDAFLAARYVALLCAIIFPPFWFGYRTYWHVRGHFVFRLPPSILDEIANQMLVTALPEEAFFRGFLQTSLDRVWPPRWRILGADLGPGWLVAAAVFAVGHVLTIPHPARLAVFFPALAFGWLRSKTGGIGAPLVFHALCNLLSATLARGYGLSP
jgi:membrane protease YdiL (CAAX protease family)